MKNLLNILLQIACWKIWQHAAERALTQDQKGTQHIKKETTRLRTWLSQSRRTCVSNISLSHCLLILGRRTSNQNLSKEGPEAKALNWKISKEDPKALRKPALISMEKHGKWVWFYDTIMPLSLHFQEQQSTHAFLKWFCTQSWNLHIFLKWVADTPKMVLHAFPKWFCSSPKWCCTYS